MAAADSSVMEAQFIEMAVGVAPASLQRQECGIVVQAETQRAAAVAHAVEKLEVRVGKAVDILSKSERVKCGDTVAELHGQAERIFRGRQEGRDAKQMVANCFYIETNNYDLGRGESPLTLTLSP